MTSSRGLLCPAMAYGPGASVIITPELIETGCRVRSTRFSNPVVAALFFSPTDLQTAPASTGTWQIGEVYPQNETSQGLSIRIGAIGK